MKALTLLSGGLDSILATKLVLDQGIEVVAVTFVLPFTAENVDYASKIAERFDITHLKVEVGPDYFEVIRNPKHGYGSGMNPCIDCRIYLLKEAKRIADVLGAKFIVTGDVLGERPMSQHRKALTLEEREAGLEDLILRPLSAKLLPVTIPECEGWIDREKLLSISGKSRKPQIALAEQYGLQDAYPAPAGGCLLTDKEYAAKVRDLFEHTERVTNRDIQILRLGRHFRFGIAKIIVGRNERENSLLIALKMSNAYMFEVPDCGSPITIVEGASDPETIKLAARLTARYSDARTDPIVVEYGRESEGPRMRITVSPLEDEEVDRLRI
ncbi:MAG: 7-cyano-7-deazaguanine synthase [Methanomicrobia archaeon]|nr:7-cyano-7-deazaguanine synthase [Methanomicrobia archaeon]